MPACSELPYCSALNGSTPCTFSSDADISGTGILLSFIISAAAAFIIAGIGLLFTTSDAASTSEQEQKLYLGALCDVRQPWTVNLDDIFYRDSARIARPLRRVLTWRRKLLTRQAVQTVLLILSDQALISGVAVLTVALGKRTTISEYHYAIIATLANVAFTVLQSSTLLLNGYFSDSTFRGAWRATIATIFAALLLVDNIVQGHAHWLDSFGSPVQCVYNTLGTQYSRDPATIVSVIINCLLIYSGWLQCVRVLAPTIFRLPWLIKLMVYPTKVLTCALPAFKAISCRRKTASRRTTRAAWTTARIALYPLVLITLLLGSITHSRLFDMIRIGILLLTSSTSLFAARTYAFGEGQDGDDTSWGFGQALAVFMLALPLLNAAEVWTDALHTEHAPSSTSTNASFASDTKPLDYSSRVRRASQQHNPDDDASMAPASPLAHYEANQSMPVNDQDFSSITKHCTFRITLYLFLGVVLAAGVFVVYISAEAANGTG